MYGILLPLESMIRIDAKLDVAGATIGSILIDSARHKTIITTKLLKLMFGNTRHLF